MYTVRGSAYALKNEYDRAIQDFDQAIRLNPNNADPYIRRGLHYANKKEYDRAIQDYDQAIRLNPNDAAAYSVRAATAPKRAYIWRSSFRHFPRTLQIRAWLVGIIGWDNVGTKPFALARADNTGSFRITVSRQFWTGKKKQAALDFP